VSIGNIKSKLPTVVFIPYWIAEAVQRQSLALSDLVDYEKIRPALSMHDMATFMAMQYEQATLLYAGPLANKNQAVVIDGLLEAWCHLTHTWTVEAGRESSQKTPSADFYKIAQYAQDSSVKGDVEARLYGQAVKLDRYDHAYDVVQLATQVVGVVVYPGYFSKENVDLALQAKLIDDLVRVFYRNDAKYHEIASTDLFKRHLKVLSAV